MGRMGGRSAGNQVENMGNKGGNAANHCGDVGIFWRKIGFRKIKVLTLKIIRSIFPKEYLFGKIYHKFLF